MKRLRSALTTAAATVLLSVCGVMMASPAHAEGTVHLLGDTVTVELDGVIEVGLFGGTVLSLQNPLEGVV
ncbi:hypothetical protein IPZ58_06195 [Streptomyces roseoverticillatus]|uniref:hypothetical protein n=1 Tax=Streptomyces roseoverticillatus TaxID=66429 RepID=UPI001F19EE8E|nr:hypothetical protein [Streptomyces roseoverticillatus]MCF3101170.1 hypothetical protein [Streptomyces roseoverticillatus]